MVQFPPSWNACSSWPGHVEDEGAARLEGTVDAAEEPGEVGQRGAHVVGVVERLADGGDGHAGWHLEVVEG
jgi:hypothetical protein